MFRPDEKKSNLLQLKFVGHRLYYAILCEACKLLPTRLKSKRGTYGSCSYLVESVQDSKFKLDIQTDQNVPFHMWISQKLVAMKKKVNN